MYLHSACKYHSLMTIDSWHLSVTPPTTHFPVATLSMLSSTLRYVAFCFITIRIISGWMFITFLSTLCNGLIVFIHVIYMCRLSLISFTIIFAPLTHIIWMMYLEVISIYPLIIIKLIFCSGNAKFMMSTSPPDLFSIIALILLFNSVSSLIFSTLNKTH